MKKDESLLREILEEHARCPYGLGELEKASHRGEWRSSQTGNLCRVQIKVERNKFVKIVSQVEGSALAKACASIMCSELLGKNLEEANRIRKKVLNWIESREPPDSWPGDLVVYESLVRFPDRLDCAKLCWNALGRIFED